MDIPAAFQKEITRFRTSHRAPVGVGREESPLSAQDLNALYTGLMDYAIEADGSSPDLNPQPGKLRRNLMGPSWFDEMNYSGNSQQGSLTMTTNIKLDSKPEILSSITVIDFSPTSINTLLINTEDFSATHVHVRRLGGWALRGYQSQEYKIAH